MKRIALRVLDARLRGDYTLPAYATDGAAGVDLRVRTVLSIHPGT